MQDPTRFQKPLEQHVGTKFADMTRPQKYVFVAKVIVCAATFGFVFPTVQTD